MAPEASAEGARRKHPNIHICGNPATGKSSLAKKLAQKFDYLDYVDLGQEGKKRGCIDGRDETLDADILDYDKLAASMIPDLAEGGKVLDWIHSDFWEPSDLVDLVVVLTCDNTILYDRYKERGYNARKIEQNIDSEIMQEIVTETVEYYTEGEDEQDEMSTMVMTLKSDTDENMSSNLESIAAWIEMWHAE